MSKEANIKMNLESRAFLENLLLQKESEEARENSVLPTLEKAKRRAAYQACAFIHPKTIIGLGTGSTAFYAIEATAALHKQGYALQTLASSLGTKTLAQERGLPVLDVNELSHSDLYIDGADEMDPQTNVVKGGGAALFREKILSRQAKHVLWVMDESKEVKTLGHFPLPIEVLPFGSFPLLYRLEEQGFAPILRRRSIKAQLYRKEERPSLKEQQAWVLDKSVDLLISDNGNYIIDLLNYQSKQLTTLAQKLSEETGIVEHGLFLQSCDYAFVASRAGEVRIYKGRG